MTLSNFSLRGSKLAHNCKIWKITKFLNLESEFYGTSLSLTKKFPVKDDILGTSIIGGKLAFEFLGLNDLYGLWPPLSDWDPE